MIIPIKQDLLNEHKIPFKEQSLRIAYWKKQMPQVLFKIGGKIFLDLEAFNVFISQQHEKEVSDAKKMEALYDVHRNRKNNL